MEKRRRVADVADPLVASVSCVQPLGNSFLQRSDARRSGLGFFAALSDEMLLILLESVCDVRSLLCLQQLSHFWYGLAADETWWKTRCMLDMPLISSWHLTWQNTLRHHVGLRAAVPLRLHDVFSDTLFAPRVALQTRILARWLRIDNVPRVDGRTLTRAEFQRRFELPNRPCVIEGLLDQWPAREHWPQRAYWCTRFAERSLHARGIEFAPDAFFAYADRNSDELPLYVFDKAFGEKVPALAADWRVPALFDDDLLALLPADVRPDFRWLLIGGRRSGSTWHTDPNCTNAFNATLSGAKRWMMLPPHVQPPGVFVRGADVTVPLSLLEWWSQFYDDCARLAPLQATLHPGDVMFVPRNWWHTVLNLTDDAVAVTQNYLPPSALSDALQWLQTPDRVSGTSLSGPALASALADAVATHRPEVWAAHEAAEQRRREQRESRTALFAGPRQFAFGF